jgi:hypothetical protein
MSIVHAARDQNGVEALELGGLWYLASLLRDDEAAGYFY